MQENNRTLESFDELCDWKMEFNRAVSFRVLKKLGIGSPTARKMIEIELDPLNLGSISQQLHTSLVNTSRSYDICNDFKTQLSEHPSPHLTTSEIASACMIQAKCS